ncbi:uncharacterized protein LOC135378187 isoform X1 [Ornithodoros turicata]|uniref:uncharacterized protein LOC135378187 isoform X1 n=1 Tax=Ornithodoros turicata TaxID=34597 RepID=UPI003139B87D
MLWLRQKIAPLFEERERSPGAESFCSALSEGAESYCSAVSEVHPSSTCTTYYSAGVSSSESDSEYADAVDSPPPQVLQSSSPLERIDRSFFADEDGGESKAQLESFSYGKLFEDVYGKAIHRPPILCGRRNREETTNENKASIKQSRQTCRIRQHRRPDWAESASIQQHYNEGNFRPGPCHKSSSSGSWYEQNSHGMYSDSNNQSLDGYPAKCAQVSTSLPQEIRSEYDMSHCYPLPHTLLSDETPLPSATRFDQVSFYMSEEFQEVADSFSELILQDAVIEAAENITVGLYREERRESDVANEYSQRIGVIDTETGERQWEALGKFSDTNDKNLVEDKNLETFSAEDQDIIDAFDKHFEPYIECEDERVLSNSSFDEGQFDGVSEGDEDEECDRGLLNKSALLGNYKRFPKSEEVEKERNGLTHGHSLSESWPFTARDSIESSSVPPSESMTGSVEELSSRHKRKDPVQSSVDSPTSPTRLDGCKPFENHTLSSAQKGGPVLTFETYDPRKMQNKMGQDCFAIQHAADKIFDLLDTKEDSWRPEQDVGSLYDRKEIAAKDDIQTCASSVPVIVSDNGSVGQPPIRPSRKRKETVKDDKMSRLEPHEPPVSVLELKDKLPRIPSLNISGEAVDKEILFNTRRDTGHQSVVVQVGNHAGMEKEAYTGQHARWGMQEAHFKTSNVQREMHSSAEPNNDCTILTRDVSLLGHSHTMRQHDAEDRLGTAGKSECKRIAAPSRTEEQIQADTTVSNMKPISKQEQNVRMQVPNEASGEEPYLCDNLSGSEVDAGMVHLPFSLSELSGHVFDDDLPLDVVSFKVVDNCDFLREIGSDLHIMKLGARDKLSAFIVDYVDPECPESAMYRREAEPVESKEFLHESAPSSSVYEDELVPPSQPQGTFNVTHARTSYDVSEATSQVGSSTEKEVLLTGRQSNIEKYASFLANECMTEAEADFCCQGHRQGYQDNTGCFREPQTSKEGMVYEEDLVMQGIVNTGELDRNYQSDNSAIGLPNERLNTALQRNKEGYPQDKPGRSPRSPVPSRIVDEERFSKRTDSEYPPLGKDDLDKMKGRGKGIQGHHNSCYLDATLFAMFACTHVFDSILYRERSSDDIDRYDEVRHVLKDDIVNPLRKGQYVPHGNVMKLRHLLDQLSNVSGLTTEEKDPEEFLNSLTQILKVEPFLLLSSGQQTHLYQLFVEKDKFLDIPTVQQLFHQSIFESNIKFKKVPSKLIIQMPRFGRQFKVYSRVLPSLKLDITDILENSPRFCFVCGRRASYECRQCFRADIGLEGIGYCKHCEQSVHQHPDRKGHKLDKLGNIPGFSEGSPTARTCMDLFAVVCIETSHYVCFVKCGDDDSAPWCFFDSMADREGCENGYNIPEVDEFLDFNSYVGKSGIEKLQELTDDKMLPRLGRKLVCDAYMCMYLDKTVRQYE